MKNKLKIAILILIICIVSLLVGCANGKADGGDISFTIDEIYANNQVDTVLQSYSTMACREVTYSGNRVNSVDEFQYYRKDGYLHVDERSYDFEDDKRDDAVVCFDKQLGGAAYMLTRQKNDVFISSSTEEYISTKILTIYSAEDYEKRIIASWIYKPANYIETLDSTYMQDGYIVATTLTKYQNYDSSYTRTKYVMEPEHGHVVYMEEYQYDLEHGQSIPDVEYSMETNVPVIRKETSVFYDERWSFGKTDPRTEIIVQQEDHCELTVTEYNESSEPVIRVFPVAHGTYVDFDPIGDYNVYYDEELTEELSLYEIVDTSGDAVKVFMAKR